MVPSLHLLSCESSVSAEENPDRKKKHCKTYYHYSHHHSYDHYAYHNHLWSYRQFHLPYPNQIFFQLKRFSNHLHLNHCQPRNVKIFCLIVWLFHQNFKHLHHHLFAKCFPHHSKLSKFITSPTSSSPSIETPQ